MMILRNIHCIHRLLSPPSIIRTLSTKPPPFEKILIANRGEIACRVAKTCRRLGIQTVAIYSQADGRGCFHASVADEAYEIGTGPAASDSYLRGDEVLEIAMKSGAQAIHPGYGFLSENATFASSCAESNLVFIGPPPSAIFAMGSKSESKNIMMKANVPCTPGYHGEEQDDAFLLHMAEEHVGFPLLIKASMGGGGKGMRLVFHPQDFLSNLSSCRRESLSSFQNDTVILEKYLQNPRHIEVQIFADSHDNVLHLFERDCSLQRRHQKIIEEAPAPGITNDLRKRMGEVAVNAARAVGYVNAGTVEFLLDEENDEFYFCEMNTRLQVEHPVTEQITGLDLVEWQLRVAAGEELPIRDQNEICSKGHAMEARIYAENPAQGLFLPGTGKITYLNNPEGEGVRVDTGVREGDTVSVFYDPMISKLIVHGRDRDHALRLLSQSLQSYRILGIPTNIPFLQNCVNHIEFQKGQISTGFLSEFEEDVQVQNKTIPTTLGQALCVLSLLLYMEGRIGISDLKMAQTKKSPWSSLSGSWRLDGDLERVLHFPDENSILVSCYRDGSFGLRIMEQQFHVSGTLHNNGQLRAFVNERQITLTSIVQRHENGMEVHLWSHPNSHIGSKSETYCSLFCPTEESLSTIQHGGSGIIKTPMPGKIVNVNVNVGDVVKLGHVMVVLEAMKMEHVVKAPMDGIVTMVGCEEGEIVEDGCVLVVVEDGEAEKEGDVA